MPEQLPPHLRYIFEGDDPEPPPQASVTRKRNKQTNAEIVKLISDRYPEQRFSSGAKGWRTGGRAIPVEVDGQVRLFAVSILIRDEATIPLKE